MHYLLNIGAPGFEPGTCRRGDRATQCWIGAPGFEPGTCRRGDRATQCWIGAPGFEPGTSWSRTKRATNCATPRFSTGCLSHEEGHRVHLVLSQFSVDVHVVRLLCAFCIVQRGQAGEVGYSESLWICR